jgi:hypothetical protein
MAEYKSDPMDKTTKIALVVIVIIFIALIVVYNITM